MIVFPSTCHGPPTHNTSDPPHVHPTVRHPTPDQIKHSEPLAPQRPMSVHVRTCPKLAILPDLVPVPHAPIHNTTIPKLPRMLKNPPPRTPPTVPHHINSAGHTLSPAASHVAPRYHVMHALTYPASISRRCDPDHEHPRKCSTRANETRLPACQSAPFRALLSYNSPPQRKNPSHPLETHHNNTPNKLPSRHSPSSQPTPRNSPK